MQSTWDGGGAVVLRCGEVEFYSFSVLDVLPSEVAKAKAKAIGYAELLGATKSYDQYDPANDFACD